MIRLARILFYSGAAALILYSTWNPICYVKGVLDAEFNILIHRKIVRTYAPPLIGFHWGKRWNGETGDDTTWVADSLLFTKFGYEARRCATLSHPSFFQEEAGMIYTVSGISYTRGYGSVYNPYLEAQVMPAALAEARSILAARPANWKDGLSDEEKRMRLLFK